MVDMRILSDPYEEECFLILKSNLPKMKDEDALELYVKLKKSYKRDRGLMRYIFEETDKIAQDMMKRLQSANIVLLKHSTVESAVSRIQGFADTIKNYPQYKIIDSAECEGQLERAMPVMQNILERHSKVDVVMSLNDPSALGALAAIESMKRTNILVYGVDGTPDLKSLIKQSPLVAGTAAQSPIQFGRLAAKNMYSLLNRKDVPEIIEVPVTLITKDNIDTFNVRGWQ